MKSKGYDSMASWFAAFACAVIGFLVVIPMRMAGFMFVIIIDQYKVDREKATIPIVVFGMLRSLTGPFIGYLGQTIGARATTTLGCFLASLGIGLCYFADNITTVIIYLGFIYGLGLGFGVSLVPEILKQHFEKNINVPFGIYATGGCLGAIVMPKVLQLLSIEYGNSGMFLILSAIVLNSVPAALVLKNPKNNLRNNKFKTMLNNSDASNSHTATPSLCDNNLEKRNENTNLTTIIPHKTPLNDYKNGKTAYDNANFDMTFIEDKSVTIIEKNNSLSTTVPHQILNNSENVKTTHYNVIFNMDDEFSDIKKDYLVKVNNITDKNNIDEFTPTKSVNGNENEKLEININYFNTELKNHTKSNRLQSLKLFINPTFYLTMFVQSCHGFVTTLTWTIIVDLGRDRGLSTELSLYFLMFFPVAEMFGSLGLNWIVNRGLMTQTYYCMTCYLILGVVEMCLVWIHGFALMMVCILIFGAVSGSLATTFPGMVYEFFDEDQHSMALTSRFVLYSVLCLTKSPIIGYFRGTLGSYNWVLYIITLSCILSAILVSFTPVVASWRRRKLSEECNLASS